MRESDLITRFAKAGQQYPTQWPPVHLKAGAAFLLASPCEQRFCLRP